MDFSWTEEQQELRALIIDFAEKQLDTDIVALDRNAEFNRDGWDKCAQFGIHGLPIPEEYGGTGRDPLTTIYALESLGYACKDNGLMFSINAHMWTASLPLLNFGSDEQKEEYLPKLCSGELIGGNAMSEPGSGSDAYALRAKADKQGNDYVLNGNKLWVTNGPVADIIVVFATVDRSKGARGISAFIVPTDTPGFNVASSIEKMGNRTSPMAEIFLEDCRIPEHFRLGREGAGTALFTHAMTWERGFILATAVGAMQRQLEVCIAFSKERKQFGEPIANFQLVSSKLVDMALRLEQSRTLLYKVGWLRSQGRTSVKEAAMAKLCISENWVKSCQDLIQIHGGMGYAVESGYERELRDAIGSRIYSGTSEIQRVLIASLIGL
jgi:alkylation response protein AidB-like acyl-CoA dehydrogenase